MVSYDYSQEGFFLLNSLNQNFVLIGYKFIFITKTRKSDKTGRLYISII